VPINKISKYLTLAVIASEDQRFIDHSGFDIEEIKRAIEESGRGKRLRGASTISQQVAKNLFLWPHKSFFRKTLEAYYTFFIELVWSKQRIIEVYLNIAEFGNKIYGVENVAYIHFNKSAININEVEAALIAAVLPNPLKYSINKPSRYLIKRRDRILQQMKLMGGIRVVEKLY
jgi:monofunctional biosynthetic peptidoglycan transglycosylase